MSTIRVDTITDEAGTGAPTFSQGATVTGTLAATTLTGTLTSSNLTGALPAIDGSALTGIEGTQTGVVNYYAASAAPTGFIKANGATISRTTYANLFAVVGTTYGAGDGSTTFKIPDLRGEFLRGWDDSRGVDSGRSFGGSQSFAIENITGAFGKIRVQLNTNYSTSGAFAGSTGPVSGDNGSGGAATVNFTFDASRSVNTASETRPRNIALLACIKY
tara:strand:- start:612 stop:1265 length:654 start_codon:yes stop_codon:yes gene_type:complete